MNNEGPSNPITDKIVSEIEEIMASFRQQLHKQMGAEYVRRETGISLSIPLYMCIISVSKQSSCRLSDISKQLELDASTTSRHMQQLIDQGLIQTTPDPIDRRATLHTLTVSGESVLHALQNARTAYLHRVLREWSIEDQQTLSRLLRQFVNDLTAIQETPS